MGKPTILLVKEIYYPILTAVALPANLMTIVILSRGNCGLSKCISVYMIAKATADLLVIIFYVKVHYIFNYHFPFSILSHTSWRTGIIYSSGVRIDLSVWFNVSFAFDRFVVICCQKFKTQYCTKSSAIIIVATFSFLMVLKNIPLLFAYEPQYIINKVQWGCQASVAFFSSSAGTGYIWFYSAWLAWLPFTLIAMFNSLTIQCIGMANRARARLQGHKSEDHSNSETENQRKSIILLFSISVGFILLWLTNSVTLAITKIANPNHYEGGFTNPNYIAIETGEFLKLLSCFLNPCIYAATQNKFKEELKVLLSSPWRIIKRLLEKCQYEESL